MCDSQVKRAFSHTEKELDDHQRGYKAALAAAAPPLPPCPSDEDTGLKSLFSSLPSSCCDVSPLFSSHRGICQERNKEEGVEGGKKTGIEVDPSVNKAASDSNFGEKRQSQHEGGAVRMQVQADESGTGEALGWRDQR